MNELNGIIKNKINEQNIDNYEGFNESLIPNSDLLPVKVLNSYIKQFQKSVCKIKIDKSFGTGILIQLKKGDDLMYGLITCEHVIEQKLINNNEKIEIYYNYINNNFKQVSIILNEKERFIRNYRYLNLDITVVEINPNESNEIEKEFFLKTNFLEQNENLKDKTLYIFQFPKGVNELNFSTGKFYSVDTSYRFIHLATTDHGSSGGPIFIFIEGKSYLIGIHKGGNNNKNIGVFLYPVINSLKENAYYTKGKEVIGGTFEGEYLPGNKQNGVFIKSKEEKYIGELVHFIPNGIGTLYKNKRILYYGKFVNGNYEGEGKLYNEDGYYEGQFVNNKKHGKGTLYDSNQNIKYSGYFVNDNYEGEGQLFYEDGSYYEGQFVNNKRHGKGKLYSKNGKLTFEGDFNNDTYEDKGNVVAKNSPTFKLNDNAVDDTINELLSMLHPLGTQLNVNYSCGNCECSTNDHYYDSTKHKWHCKKCNKDCYNRPSVFVNNLLNLFK